MKCARVKPGHASGSCYDNQYVLCKNFFFSKMMDSFLNDRLKNYILHDISLSAIKAYQAAECLRRSYVSNRA